MKRLLALFGAIVLAFSAASCCMTQCKPDAPLAAEFELHRNYGDHMVLQREVPIRISGTATAGQAVKVTLGDDTRYAVADATGEWRVAMPARKATKDGESLTLTVSGANGKVITCSDVLIGEVWMCCGQSNMEMPMWTNAPHWRDNGGDKVIAEADKYANKIRLFNAAATKYVSPSVIQSEPRGKWLVAKADDIARFSAVGYYFGRELNQKLDVPVGLVSTCWSGTRIEPWISAEAYRNAFAATNDPLFGGNVSIIDNILNGVYDKEVKKAKESKSDFAKRELAWHEKIMSFNAEAIKAAADWKNPDFDDSAWDTRKVSQLSVDEVCRAWVRYTVEIPQNMAGKELKLYLGAIDDADITYFNGVKVGQTDIRDANYWVKERVYTVPADLAKAGKAVIAVQFINYAGPGVINPGTNGLALSDGTTKIALNGAWRFKLETKIDLRVVGNRPQAPNSQGVLASAQTPTTLFNSLINPWTRYNTRGMIWYQGCSNAGQPDEYAKLFGLLREDWMKHWDNPKMVFITTQLSGFEPGKSWPRFREMQFDVAQKYDNVGIAISIDKGNARDIHPHEKLPVAQRLCAEAMRLCFGYKGITSGPVYKSCKVVDNKIVLNFDFVGQGIVTTNGKQPAGFEIAGENEAYFPAEAVITGKGEITLSSPEVSKPVIARYAWCAYNGDLNTENKDGFPMVPFRTNKPVKK